MPRRVTVALAPVAALRHGGGVNLVSAYHRAIDRIVALAPPPDKFVHVEAGLALWVLAAFLLRRPLASPLPLLAVALLELGNETMDRLYAGSWRWPDTLGDAFATLMWPTILTLLLRAAPRLSGRRR